jgi:phage baseplate assembly protein W
MIPSNTGFLTSNFTIKEQPSKTYKMRLDKNVIAGQTDSRDALHQAIFKILSTERYRSLIYSWNYGIELENLFGMPISYVVPELQRRITEALTWDSRILSVDSFEFETKKNTVICSFTAHTVYGDIDTETAVNI